MQQQVSIRKSGADAGICPAQPGAVASPAWRTTRRPEYLLRHVLCAQLHCRDWVFTSMCRIHAPLLRPPQRTAALHDLSCKQRCHADALLLPPASQSITSAIFPPRRRAGRQQRCASLHIATGPLCEFERLMGHPLYVVVTPAVATTSQPLLLALFHRAQVYVNTEPAFEQWVFDSLAPVVRMSRSSESATASIRKHLATVP